MKNYMVKAEGYIDSVSELDYRHITNFKEVFPIMHFHDYYEIFLVTKGKLIHVINHEKIMLQHGHLVFIRPFDLHKFEIAKGEKCGFINLAILCEAIEDFFNYMGEGFNRNALVKPTLPPMVMLSPSQAQLLVEKMDRLHTIPVNDKEIKRMHLRILLVEIFANYFNSIQQWDKNKIPQWLQLLIEEMQKPQNFTEGLPALNRIACKSKEHLCRVFRKYFDKSPSSYVNELKLNYAANQILYSQNQITQIAFDSGFENISHFYHLFGDYFGLSPAKFRENNLKNPIFHPNS